MHDVTLPFDLCSGWAADFVFQHLIQQRHVENWLSTAVPDSRITQRIQPPSFWSAGLRAAPICAVRSARIHRQVTGSGTVPEGLSLAEAGVAGLMIIAALQQEIDTSRRGGHGHTCEGDGAS